jgi:hypothetical protein
VLDRVGGRSDQGRAGLRLSKPGAPAQPGAQRRREGDQQRLELPAGVRARLDRPGAGKLQQFDRLGANGDAALGVGLGVLVQQWPARDPGHAPGDRHLAGVQVDVAPLQAAPLAAE